MKRTDIINHLFNTKIGYKGSYLEIGLNNPDDNYFHVFSANKECVDPMFDEDFSDLHERTLEDKQRIVNNVLTYRMTSDAFFAKIDKKYDLIFIDGLHIAEQVQRDIINSYNHLNPGGYIVIHDCLPLSEEAQNIPRTCLEWNGTTWKAIPNLYKADLNFVVVNADSGCGIIKYSGEKNFDKYTITELDYKDVFLNTSVKNSIMHVISEEEFLSL